MIAIGSAFRNSALGVRAYMDRVVKLRKILDLPLRVIAVEGDSADMTRDELTSVAAWHGIELELRTCNHGGPVYGSIESLERFQALSKVGNAIFEAVRPTDDVLLYVESDLEWEPEVLWELIFHALNHSARFDVFAPLVMAGEHFYDIWGYRLLDGRRFSPFQPFAPGLFEKTFYEVGSVGSCLAIPGTLARKARILDGNCLVGWCTNAREEYGAKISVVPQLSVRQA